MWTQTMLRDEMTYSQALTVLYDPTMEAGDADGK